MTGPQKVQPHKMKKKHDMVTKTTDSKAITKVHNILSITEKFNCGHWKAELIIWPAAEKLEKVKSLDHDCRLLVRLEKLNSGHQRHDPTAEEKLLLLLQHMIPFNFIDSSSLASHSSMKACLRIFAHMAHTDTVGWSV